MGSHSDWKPVREEQADKGHHWREPKDILHSWNSQKERGQGQGGPVEEVMQGVGAEHN